MAGIQILTVCLKLQMVPSEAVSIDEVEPSPWDEIFESEANLCEISRLEQRLAQIDLQVRMKQIIFVLWFYVQLLDL